MQIDGALPTDRHQVSKHIEAIQQAMAVNVELFEDFDHRIGREMPLLGPPNNVEIFFACFEMIHNAV